MRIDMRTIAELTDNEQAALNALVAAVYPPEFAATSPERVIEWAVRQWGVTVWDDYTGQALAHSGMLVRQALWNDCGVTIGGIGGVKTHPEARGRGFATEAIKRSVQFFQDQGDIDIGLLVCTPHLIPFYGRMGWRVFSGDLIVTQHGEKGKFTFNTPMTYPIRLQSELRGMIDLLGPPW